MITRREEFLVDSPSAPNTQPARPGPGQPREQSLTLRDPADGGGYVDGGWWPRSLDLVAELPALLTAVEAAGYREVRRVSFALSAWDGQPPRRSTMLNRVVKLGGFRSQNAAEIGLVDSSGWKRITLVVVPPESDPVVARRALDMAGLDGDQHRAREILDLAREVTAPANHSACVDELAAVGRDAPGCRLP
jgi:hypothetical protein